MSEIYDVAVVGGGLAGWAAAVSAARLGAKTFLMEQLAFLGGMATAGLVNPFMSHCTSTGEKLIAGLFDELQSRLQQLNGILDRSFDSELMKFTLQESTLESGVELRFHTYFVGARFDNGEFTIRLISKSGEEEIRCLRLIDCTGDGDAAVSLDASFEMGDSEGLPQAMTLMFDVGGVDLVRALKYVRDHPNQMRFPKLPPDADINKLVEKVVSVAGYYDLIAQARAAGEYKAPGDLIFYISRPRQGEVVFNTTHIGCVRGTDARDLTLAEIEGRRQMMSIISFLRKYVPGFENSYLLRSAAHVGIRETRRIVGDYVFSEDDVEEGRKFPDCICRLAYPVDIHSGKGEGYVKEERSKPQGLRRGAPPAGDWYEVPYRCLLPRGLDNVIVAGRCVSSTQGGHGAIRIMPACIAMGQAAGTAAALSLQNRVTPRELDINVLINALRAQGALI
ncbi:MAG: FAD-dependent oxidoreductase [Armatimonadota bacterium]